MESIISISVRSLVEYVYRSGSIDAGFRTSSSLHEGTRVHQKIQRTYEELDQKECFLEIDMACENLPFHVEGRCDGLLFRGQDVVIDEIKSTSGDLSVLEENSYPVHWAQAKWYAYMYATAKNVEQMVVQLTYVQVPSEEQKSFRQVLSHDELEMFAKKVLQQYAPYGELLRKHRARRTSSIQALAFPFPTYRQGQRKFASAVYKTIVDEKNILAKAPTGIGKTISTTFPVVKAMGEGLIQRLFYVTAKTTTRTAAEEACKLMKDHGLILHAVTLTAKDKICFKEETRCQKDYCEYANGYYDRINEAILDVLENETIMDRNVIERYAKKHTVCPFEFSVDLAYAADAVICDYNYIYDPRVSFKRLFEEQKRQSVLLVDESHNLVDRAREMFSAELYKSLFLELKRKYKGTNDTIYKIAHKLNQHFIALRKKIREQKQVVEKEQNTEILALLEEFIVAAEQALLHATGEEQALLDSFFAAQSYVRISKLYDERFVTYVECTGNEVHLKMFCLDPSYLLNQVAKGYRASIYFSATLTPLSYFHRMLGCKEEDYTLSVPSPFAKEQLDVFVQALSTRYHDRDYTKSHIVRMLRNLLASKPQNTLIFFPSYQYLQAVYTQFAEEDSEFVTIVQSTSMKEEERDEFLERFQPSLDKPVVGFAVLGGVFSEGIDLKGDRLNTVVVVGVGLPQLCLEREIIKQYFHTTGANGYNYSYVYPGMNKVQQAGGRLIRTEQDTGTIVLVDDRFLKEPYVSLLPEEWQSFTVIS
ncbi:ATP-dependent DNA helicase [Ectobacillus sp. sgz5001026]|uniref:ATP-dependent DNA helicase n=1 Tax=Ectobacillus sp. sgz5001026 TaxID=3242473 RepID=UPI0036D2828E